MQANMTTGTDTVPLHVSFCNDGSEFATCKRCLVTEAQIRNKGVCKRWPLQRSVTQRSGRGTRQPPFAAHHFRSSALQKPDSDFFGRHIVAGPWEHRLLKCKPLRATQELGEKRAADGEAKVEAGTFGITLI